MKGRSVKNEYNNYHVLYDLISTQCTCKGRSLAFQRWFWIGNWTIFGKVMAIYVKRTSLSEMVRLSTTNHRWKARNKPYHRQKEWVCAS